MSGLPEYVVERTFQALPAQVWRAWTDPELLAQWYGPGVTTIIHGFDLEPGGRWLNEMRFGDKQDFSSMVFQAVDAPARLEWLHSSTDGDWNVVTNPMMPDWPRVLHTTVTFTERNGATDLRFTQVPVDASEAELACFAAAKDNMTGGWQMGFEVIDGLLEALD